MTTPLRPGPATPARYRAKLASLPQQIMLAEALHHLCRVAMRGRFARQATPEDSRDPDWTHVLIEDADEALAGCFRLRQIGPDPARSRATLSYDLGQFLSSDGPVAEMAGFCVHPDAAESDVLGVAWAALMALLDRMEARLLVGLCSFEGTDPQPHRHPFALLRASHVAPEGQCPPPLAAESIRLEALEGRPDRVAGLRGLPPVLRGLLGHGGCVADRAVVNRAAGTLDLLAMLDPARIPPPRRHALRARAPHLG
ncbi:GNAT family N-acyltransferase [Rubellimicrobium arenae]|uniref:GNAT family N-acyltransferase n=1 Tax=Rubellimicrobium arenae TaxID=2817372 RepID=UPI001B31013B|nr:GNAT family N-acyltransferase [Rubellimicrobium arenae]